MEILDMLQETKRFDVEIVTSDPNTLETIENGFKTWETAYEAALRLIKEYEAPFKVRVA